MYCAGNYKFAYPYMWLIVVIQTDIYILERITRERVYNIRLIPHSRLRHRVL